jgi:hypothetical protein
MIAVCVALADLDLVSVVLRSRYGEVAPPVCAAALIQAKTRLPMQVGELYNRDVPIHLRVSLPPQRYG